MKRTLAAVVVAVACLAPVNDALARDSVRGLYDRALARERALRTAENAPTLKQLHGAIDNYERIVRRFPASAYSDNALWQAGQLAVLAFERYGQTSDKETAARVLAQLRAQYPSSSLVPRAEEVIRGLDAPSPTARAVGTAMLAKAPPAPAEPRDPAPSGPSAVTIRGIKRTALPDGVRVTIELDGEALYRQERLDNPGRVFFDLKGARPSAAVQDARLEFDDDVVREIRLGRHPPNTTRVVMDLNGVETYSVFTLYNPFRVVIDFRRSAAALVPVAPLPAPPGPAVAVAVPTIDAPAKASSIRPAARPIPSRPSAESAALTPPAVPAANSNGQFSLARQLGLGISRIVLDAGHGGHDPGAGSHGITESELVLDVAARLRKLLEKQPGIEVTMTRDTDVFVPLEERTAIANRQSADLFLSIHANASRNPKARGVETYFLNFASNPEAEAVAARENSASGRTMHSLPEIVRAIALNNKIDESRDFADAVQKAMVSKLSSRNKQLRDLGVKQAPFVVLIGAGMPSVLAEISFVTNKQEGQLLKTGAYRQQIAEALLDAIVRYQKSLKKVSAMATR